MPPVTLDHCRAALEGAGLKATQQRMAILQTLWEGHAHHAGAEPSAADASHPDAEHPTGHHTAEDLFQQLRPRYPSLSLGTVYRTLEALVAAGLIRRLPGALEGPTRFDADVRPHHHLIDPERGVLRDLHDPELDALLADYFARRPIPGFDPTQLQLTVIGRSSD